MDIMNITWSSPSKEIKSKKRIEEIDVIWAFQSVDCRLRINRLKEEKAQMKEGSEDEHLLMDSAIGEAMLALERIDKMKIERQERKRYEKHLISATYKKTKNGPKPKEM